MSDRSRRGRRDQGKGKRRKRGDEGSQRLQNFSTLVEVSGIPKPHKHKSRIPLLDDKIIKEPLEKCAICGETIQSIADAMLSPTGEHVHFSCVLDKIKESKNLSENQCVSYVGSGYFAVCEKDSEGKWRILERIQYESPENFERMKGFVKEQMV